MPRGPPKALRDPPKTRGPPQTPKEPQGGPHSPQRPPQGPLSPPQIPQGRPPTAQGPPGRTQDLDLDVPGALDELLHEKGPVAEGGQSLRAGSGEALLQLLRTPTPG